MIDVNGVTLEVTHAGEGPMVLLLHGFPELAYSWRHQIAALAEAGYHAVAPNQRGYGRSDCPEDLDAYSIFELVGDSVALVQAMDHEDAVVVGHDWGSMVAWQCALFRPDVFRGVMGMSVPYLPRGPYSIIDLVGMAVGEGFNYIVHFQQPELAEQELDADPIFTMRRILWLASGDRPADLVGPDPATQTSLLEGDPPPEGLPSWLSDGDLMAYAEAFTHSGFRGGINWYRNMQRNHDLSAPWTDAKVTIPASFVGGLSDFVVNGGPVGEAGPSVALMEAMCSDFRGSTFLPGIGHWNQQEDPAGTNSALLEFLSGL
jgi:pimeloyl-ACP methyl ester carboxylesterase